MIFTDVSAELLAACDEAASQAGIAERCTFVTCRAEDLAAIPDCSVDVVTMRAVLMYVTEKQECFKAFYRVLRPGGRLSLFEPVNRLAQELTGRTPPVHPPGPRQPDRTK